MIELDHDQLIFSCPEIHPDAWLTITFKRTLRIPDDGSDYPLPPGIGNFPLRHLDDYASRIPEHWLTRGGVMLPMYQSEAMWIDFQSGLVYEHDTFYPFAVKIATGKINAVSGQAWGEGLQADPQSYVVVPEQPWIDGYCVEKGVIRQFVGMPLGTGYSAEEQVTGQSEFGGVQLQVYPMRWETFEKRFPKVCSKEDLVMSEPPMFRRISASKGISLAPGGRMRQEIYEDPFDVRDWDQENSSRCFVHLMNSLHWRTTTGQVPPTWMPTAADYSEAELPWYEYYQEDPDIEANTTRRPMPEPEVPFEYHVPSFIKKPAKANAFSGSPILKKLKSVFQLGKERQEEPLPENESAQPKKVIHLQEETTQKQVREGDF
jgi:hypothetical protein